MRAGHGWSFLAKAIALATPSLHRTDPHPFLRNLSYVKVSNA